MAHSSRFIPFSLAVLLATFGLAAAAFAEAPDLYEPNDSEFTATDLWALAGSPSNPCLGRRILYYAYPANADPSDVDWYKFKLRGEHSLETGLFVASDGRLRINLYREGASGRPGALTRTWLMNETSAEPFGYRSLPVDVSSGSDDTWFLEVEPVPVMGEKPDITHYDFSIVAQNPYVQSFESKSGWTASYYSNEADLLAHKEGGEQVVRTVIVQHGYGRNGHDYFDYVRQAALDDGIEDQVLIIAPSFMTSSDCPASDEAYWSASGWKFGYDSRGPAPVVSSYTVVDELVDYGVSERWPNVEKVVVAGHSGGGQLAHRYAAATRAPENIAPIPMSFVAANSGSYLWPDARRPLPLSIDTQVPDSKNLLDFYTEERGANTFILNADCDGDTQITPGEYGGCLAETVTTADIDFDGRGTITAADLTAQTSCLLGFNDYDDYATGVIDRHLRSYFISDGDLAVEENFEAWVDRYTGRELTVLLGTDDTGTYEDNGANPTCMQMVQGKNRWLRGLNYFIHFDAFYPDHAFNLSVVPGVGHSGGGMLASWEGKYRMFYEDGSLTAPPYCGLGFEPALFLPLWAWVRGRRNRSRAGAAVKSTLGQSAPRRATRTTPAG